MAQSIRRCGRISCMEVLENRRLLSASVSDASPDLAVSLKVHGPTLLLPGERTSAKLTVANEGGNLKGAILPASMYVSSTPYVDSKSVLFATGNLIFNLKTGKTETKTLHGSLPGTVPSGTFYIIIVVNTAEAVGISGKTGGDTFENPLGNYEGTYSDNFGNTVSGSMALDVTARGKRLFSTIAFDDAAPLPAIRTHISPISPYTFRTGDILIPSSLSKSSTANIDAVLLDQTISQSYSHGNIKSAPLSFMVSIPSI